MKAEKSEVEKKKVLFLSVFAACFAYSLILIRFSVFVTDSTAASLFPLPDIKAIHTL